MIPPRRTDSLAEGAHEGHPAKARLRVHAQRLRAAFTVSEDRNKMEDVLVNGLIAGYVVMAIVGAIEAWFLRDPASWVQPVATLGLTAWAWEGKRRGNPRPIPLLLVSATLAAAFLVVSAVMDMPQDATNSSPIVIMVGAGAMALVTGGRRPVRLAIYVTVIAAVAVTAVQLGVDDRRAALWADVASSVIVMALAYYLIRTVRAAYDSGSSRYAGLIETAPVAVLEADLSVLLRPEAPGPLIRDLNPLARRVLRLRDIDATTLTIDDLGNPFHDLVLGVVSAKAASGEEVLSYDGRSYIVNWKSLNRTFNRVMFSAVDITAQRAAEESLAEELRARDRFIATVSHELRTPLTGILGMLELLTAGDVDGEEADDVLEMALGQTRDMADIVQDLLVAARASSGALVVNPEEALLDEIATGVLASLPVPIDFDSSGEASVIADPVRTRQIVRNLATNAIRYGGPNRRLLVRADDTTATIEMRDDGPELAAELQKRMFEPYERSATSELPTESVGLGLSVARTLARLMDGDVTYHHDGTESVFRLSLPRAAAESAA